ncbi:MAG: transposase [Acidimicrobiia bacterium]|jgi:transposase-like protein
MSQKKRRRRHFSPEEKAAILRRHLADKVSVSDLCDEYKLQPSVLYQWQRQLLDNAARALEPRRGTDRQEAKLEAKIQTLEAKLQRKDSVIAEISEEFVKTKKELGEL